MISINLQISNFVILFYRATHKFDKLGKMSNPNLRELKIKTGVLKRLIKEKTAYEIEVDQQKQRLEKLRNEGGESHVLKRNEEILQETLVMIPDSHRRLVKAFEDLNECLIRDAELKQTPDYEAAMEALQSAQQKILNIMN